MTSSVRLALVVLALAAPLGLLARGARPALGSLERAIPEAIAGYALAGRSKLDEEVARAVRPTEYVMYRYEAPERPPVVLYAASYSSLRALGAGAHDPRICYPAQGWLVERAEETRIPVDGGELRATLMLSRLDAQQELVLFWIQPASRWPASPLAEQLLGLRDVLSGEDRYAFVRLSVPVDSTDPVDVHLREFARVLAPAVRGLLAGSPG